MWILVYFIWKIFVPNWVVVIFYNKILWYIFFIIIFGYKIRTNSGQSLSKKFFFHFREGALLSSSSLCLLLFLLSFLCWADHHLHIISFLPLFSPCSFTWLSSSASSPLLTVQAGFSIITLPLLCCSCLASLLCRSVHDCVRMCSLCEPEAPVPHPLFCSTPFHRLHHLVLPWERLLQPLHLSLLRSVLASLAGATVILTVTSISFHPPVEVISNSRARLIDQHQLLL